MGDLTTSTEQADEPPLPPSRRVQRAQTPHHVSVLFLFSLVPGAWAANDQAEAALIPILVLLSGALAGLTLGYMSLDMTTLAVLQKTGTPKQQKYAASIIPIRKNGHLLLITLILGNMLVNETLPVVAENVLGGGIQAVVISTALIVIFAEIIPQSICTRFGLQIGAWFVWPVRILIGICFIVAWPVSKLLTWILGEHSGMVYRRAELKELVAMHQMQTSETGSHKGGDLQPDTVQIVGTALDFQEKSVGDAMTPIKDVFMLDLNATKLDYETLGKILQSGHSRIPVYEEIEGKGSSKKIIGVILAKQFILLDPEDAVPLKELPIHPLPVVAQNLALHAILNTFQEGRSHMAIVAPLLPQYQAELDRVHEDADGHKEHSLFKSLFRHDSRSSVDEKKAEEGEAGSYLRKQLQKDLAGVETSLTNLAAAIADIDHPVGIITLEDVLEELIGEEILDEMDVGPQGSASLLPYIPAEYFRQIKGKEASQAPRPVFRKSNSDMPNAIGCTPTPAASPSGTSGTVLPLLKIPSSTPFLLPQRSRSQPPRSRMDEAKSVPKEPTKERSSLRINDEAVSDATAETLEPNDLSSRQFASQFDRGRRAAFRLKSCSTPTSLAPSVAPSGSGASPSGASTPVLRNKMFKSLVRPPSHSSDKRGSTLPNETPPGSEPATPRSDRLPSSSLTRGEPQVVSETTLAARSEEALST